MQGLPAFPFLALLPTLLKEFDESGQQRLGEKSFAAYVSHKCGCECNLPVLFNQFDIVEKSCGLRICLLTNPTTFSELSSQTALACAHLPLLLTVTQA